MKELVQFIVEKIVEKPDQVKIDLSTGEKENESLISVHVAKEDMGRVIGKGGRVINSIRHIMRVMEHHSGDQRTILKLEDSEE